jgi:anti-sigma regulatory factor (Ser/Thr protein kinase)
LKFDVQAQTRIATAVSEIVRNAYQYGGGGAVDFEIDTDDEKMFLTTVRDQGKGISNLDEIFSGKYVSKTGMGLGMIGAKRLLDVFDVQSQIGRGTVVKLGKLVPSKFTSLNQIELSSLLTTIERKPSDNPYEELQQQNKELMRTLEELRARQAELAQLNRELDETNRGVVALYAELNDKADFLQRASELKSHFLSNMSHEFRTPLNSILALSQILIAGTHRPGQRSPRPCEGGGWSSHHTAVKLCCGKPVFRPSRYASPVARPKFIRHPRF